MRLTVRKAETEAIVDLFKDYLEIDEDDEFALPGLEELAETTIKRVADLFSERDWYACGVQVGDQTIAYGPLSSETEVKRYAEKLAVGPAKGAKIYATAPPLRRLEQYETPPAV